MVLGACVQAASATPTATDQVDLPRSYRFAPADIVVGAGTTVTWTNNDTFTHNVQFLEGDGEALTMRPGEHVSRAFEAAGLYRYQCSLHPNDMTGTVLVTTETG
jgi:plastocyanin